jgi:hypothetical protein
LTDKWLGATGGVISASSIKTPHTVTRTCILIEKAKWRKKSHR